MLLLPLAVALAFLPAPLVQRPSNVHARPAVQRSATPLAVAGAAAAKGSEKLYTSADVPKLLGAIRAGTKKLCVVTGASSGLGLACAKAMADEGDNYVVCAVRDPEKMKAAAKEVKHPRHAHSALPTPCTYHEVHC